MANKNSLQLKIAFKFFKELCKNISPYVPVGCSSRNQFEFEEKYLLKNSDFQ